MKTILKKLFKPITGRLDAINNKLDLIINKISLEDEIIELNGARFWVPNAPRDTLQNYQLSNLTFFEHEILKDLDQYLNSESVILDLGANIGNHSVYWGKVSKVKQIFSFEPVNATFRILSKNIQINNLTDKVKLYNYGLGDKSSKGSIAGLYNINVDTIADSIGSLSIEESENGDLSIRKLDEFDEILHAEKIDFVKIDVEGFEQKLLIGATQFFQLHKPIVFIESYPGPENFDFVNEYFKNLGYSDPIKYPNSNFLYIFDK